MNKPMVLLTVAIVVLSSTAFTQIGFDDLSNSRYRAVYVPFRSPPPSYYYIPNQMVLKLAPSAADVNVIRSNDETLTGKVSLDDLNRKYGVTKFVREFPEPPSITERAVGPPVTVVPHEDLTKYYVVQFSEKFSLKQVMADYRANEYVDNVEAIGVHPVLEMIPNDPYFATDQWNFKDGTDNDIDATDAWDLETGDASVIVGDLDTGVQYNSRDLGGLSPYTNGNMWINDLEYNGTAGVDDDGNGYVDDWIGWDFVDNVSGAWPGEDADTPDNEPTDFNGHGTHVGGIMGAITNNNVMVAGLAGGWNAAQNDPANGVKVMACRIGWSAPHPVYGYEVGYVRMDFAAQAIYYAVNNGATALNCSWGSSNSGGLGAAVTYAVDHGVVVVHAAGNSGNSVADYLGNRTDVLNVAATDSSDVKASFSNYGTWVDLAAPGVDVLSTYSLHYNPNYVAWVSGTSQASPHVCGAAALLRSYVPGLTRQEVFDLLVGYTDNIDAQNPSYVGLLGSGRLNVFKSLDAAIAPSVTVIQPNGGEVLYIGQHYDITWDASDNVAIESTLVDYSVDSGVDWSRIATLSGNPGVFTWTVTGPPSDQCRVRVTCYDQVGVSGSDMSDDDFCPPYSSSADGSTPRRGLKIVGPDTAPAATALYQNAPNPFNPQTRIPYALAENGHVRIDVFNVRGQRVATLVDEYQTAGHKTVLWNASEVASGIYFYRLQAGAVTQTRKLTLMK
jgi:subtilisin family serine protease